MSNADVAYYRARANEERKHALASHRKNVAEVHLELARLYDALVIEPEIRPTLKIVVPRGISASA